MAVLSSECCDHNEYDDGEMNTYDDSKPRWMDSLRTRTPSTGKPGWKASVKANSPSMRTYSEGGSLRTQRTRPRSKSAKRSTHGRSKSPGLFGSTFASRAKQREAIGTPLVRSRANSVSSMPPDSARSRTRSLSPRRLRRQSASPARVLPKRGPNNENPRSRRDLPKGPPKKESIPIPIRKVPEAPLPKKNIPIPVRISPDPPSRPDASPRPFRDRYQFEPLGDTLGRSNVVYPGTEAHRQSMSDGQYYTKTVESFNSYFKDSSDTSKNLYSQNNNSNNSHSYQNNNGSSKSYADENLEKSFMQNSSYSQDSKDMYMNSSQGVSRNTAKTSLDRKTSSTFDKTRQETSQHRRSSNAYSEQGDQNSDHLNRNMRHSLSRSSNAYSQHSQQDENKSEHLNRNNTDSARRSSLTRGPQPLWLDGADIPQPGSAQNNVRRSSSASSKKSVSVIYIS